MKIATFENNILAIVAGTIAAEDIEPQFHALTHFPDRHAKAELADLAERLNQHDHPRREKDLSSEEDMIAAVVAHTGLSADALQQGWSLA